MTARAPIRPDTRKRPPPQTPKRPLPDSPKRPLPDTPKSPPPGAPGTPTTTGERRLRLVEAGVSQVEIAAAEGVSRQAVGQTINQALRRREEESQRTPPDNPIRRPVCRFPGCEIRPQRFRGPWCARHPNGRTLYTESKDAGVCVQMYCQRPPVEGRTECERHRNDRLTRYRRNTEISIKAGRCAKAGCSDATEAGRTCCEKHLAAMRKAAIQRRRNRITAGLCCVAGCPKRHAERRTRCEKHLEELREYARSRRAAQ